MDQLQVMLLQRILATKGAAPIDSGTTAAVAPIVEPTTNLESGNKSIIKIMKGNDLKAFIITPKIV